jgi:hypothetical protein
MRAALPNYLQRGSELVRVRFFPGSSSGDYYSIEYNREEICQVRTIPHTRERGPMCGTATALHESAIVYEGSGRYLWRGDSGHSMLIPSRSSCFGRSVPAFSRPMAFHSRWNRLPRAMLTLERGRFLRDRILTKNDSPIARLRVGSYASWGVRPIREVFVDDPGHLVATLRLAILLNYFLNPPDDG